MNTNALFDIYTLNHEIPGEDLTISIAKYQATNPGVVSPEDSKAMREFIGKHGKALSEAYRKGKASFQATVEVLEAEDNK